MVKTRTAQGRSRFSFEWSMLPYLIIVIALIAFGINMWVVQRSMARVLPEDRYQAVFLSNGQVYFGHLSPLNRGYYALNDVYYLQQSVEQPASDTSAEDDTADDANAEETSFSIIRLGEEIHQPQNGMVISKDHVLYWENLSDDSRVVEAIGNYKTGVKD